jgi:3-oxoadipate CoA-transferase alpha subunit
VVSKVVGSPEVAVADIQDGSTIMVGGFGMAGMPAALVDALIGQGARAT